MEVASIVKTPIDIWTIRIQASIMSSLGRVFWVRSAFHRKMKVTHRQVPGSIPGIEEGSTAIG